MLYKKKCFKKKVIYIKKKKKKKKKRNNINKYFHLNINNKIFILRYDIR